MFIASVSSSHYIEPLRRSVPVTSLSADHNIGVFGELFRNREIRPQICGSLKRVGRYLAESLYGRTQLRRPIPQGDGGVRSSRRLLGIIQMENRASCLSSCILGIEVQAGLLLESTYSSKENRIEYGNFIGPDIGGDFDRIESVGLSLQLISTRHDPRGYELTLLIGAGALDYARWLQRLSLAQHEHSGAGKGSATWINNQSSN